MRIPFTCLGLSLAVWLTSSASLRADDVPVPTDPAPGVQPIPVAPPPAASADTNAPRPAAVPLAPAPAPEFGGGGGAPGGDPFNGMRVGRPYYWSASGAAGYGPVPQAGFGPGPMRGSRGGCGCRGGAGGPSYGYGYEGPEYGGYGNGGPGYGAPGFGGPDYARVGYYGGSGGDPYTDHFGPGYYRHSDTGHARFPYYSYRRPWYYTGHPSYNRDTNLPW